MSQNGSDSRPWSSAELGAFIDRARRNLLFVLLGAPGGAVIFSGDIVRADEDVYALFVPKPDAVTVSSTPFGLSHYGLAKVLWRVFPERDTRFKC